jgi:hypothetical protein
MSWNPGDVLRRDDGTYMVILDDFFNFELRVAMVTWCLEYVGPGAEFRDLMSPEWTWCQVMRGFIFKRAEDAGFFLLKWG